MLETLVGVGFFIAIAGFEGLIVAFWKNSQVGWKVTSIIAAIAGTILTVGGMVISRIY